jgi:vacuolar-type H+-ATPase subunit H
MTVPSELPYGGALDAVADIETALIERDAARDAADAELAAARAEAERLLSSARIAGAEAGRARHVALLTQTESETRAIRAAGEAEAAEVARRMSAARDALVSDFTSLLLIEEA